MKLIITSTLILISIICFSQVTSTAKRKNVDDGKNEFKQQTLKETPDYSKALKILTNQVKSNPKNAEYRYFLGYTIDKLNADDGTGMPKLTKIKTIKASEQFEEVNKIEPIYKGEYFISDPYSKITSIWGALAQSYLIKKQNDSAKWAFEEGKRRGGFIEPVLEFNRQLLSNCDSNSILVTSGDLITIVVWYLQTIENLRNDITIVDASLINASWYIKYLKSAKKLNISYSDTEVDTISYLEWKPTIITIKNEKKLEDSLSWELKPTYMNNFILKGDRILIDIFKQNYFKRPIYFTCNSDSTYDLFLSKHFIDKGLMSLVYFKPIINQNDTMYILDKLANYNIDKCSAYEIKKSRNAITLLNNFRWAYFSNIYHLNDINKLDKAKRLIDEMTEKFPKNKLPFVTEEQEKYFNNLFDEIDKKNY